MGCRARRTALVVAVVTALAPLFAADAPAPPAAFVGKVVPLADAIAKSGGRLDADAAPYWLALASDDGRLWPLVKDGGSRLFFKDPELLNRPMRLTGRVLPGSSLLRVTLVHSLIKGEPHVVYYWCDICSIKRGEKMTCECCGGPMTRREDAVKK